VNYLKKNFINLLILVTGCISVIYINNKAEDVLEVSSSEIACILKIQNLIIFVLPICLFWGRFSNLFFIEKFKYMSYKKKSIIHKKFWN